jgi:hypothetical protein
MFMGAPPQYVFEINCIETLPPRTDFSRKVAPLTPHLPDDGLMFSTKFNAALTKGNHHPATRSPPRRVDPGQSEQPSPAQSRAFVISGNKTAPKKIECQTSG